MLPAYPLTVEFIADHPISEKQFREEISQSLSDLQALSVLSGSKSYSIDYYPPNEPPHTSVGGSVRFVAIVSIGQKRAEALLLVFQAIVQGLEYEVPDFAIRASMGKFQLS